MGTLTLFDFEWDVEEIKRHNENVERLRNDMQRYADHKGLPDFDTLLREMKSCNRYIRRKDGVLCFKYLKHEFTVDDFETSLVKMNSYLREINLNEKDRIFKITEDSGFYYLTDIQTPDNIMDIYTNQEPVRSERIKLGGNKEIEICQNGLICSNFVDLKRTYHSKNRLDELMNGSPCETFDMAVSGSWYYKFTLPKDGVHENMLDENYLSGTKRQLCYNMHNFETLNFKYDNSKCNSYIGVPRKWDGEAGALFSTYLERLKEVDNKNKKYLYNPALNHINHREELERYIRGEITEEGLYVSVLMDVAQNPVLIILYGLISDCKRYGISVAEFQFDDEGFMVNKYGVRHRQLADYYCRGWLTKECFKSQKEIRSFEEIKSCIFGLNKSNECMQC